MKPAGGTTSTSKAWETTSEEGWTCTQLVSTGFDDPQQPDSP